MEFYLQYFNLCPPTIRIQTLKEFILFYYATQTINAMPLAQPKTTYSFISIKALTLSKGFILVDLQNDMFKWALSGEDIINTFEHILKGERLQEVENKTIDKVTGEEIKTYSQEWVLHKGSRALLNESGISKIINSMYTFLNRNMYLANLSEERALKITRDVCLSVNRQLFFGNKLYNLSTDDYGSVVNQLLTLCLSATSRPMNEGERKFFKTTTQEIRQLVSSDKGGGGSGGGNLFGFDNKNKGNG